MPSPYGVKIGWIICTCNDLSIVAIFARKFTKQCGPVAGGIIARWFKPATQIWGNDAYWDPREECVKTLATICSNKWGQRQMICIGKSKAPMPQCKWVATDEELIDNSISAVEMVASQKKKVSKSALKLSASMGERRHVKSLYLAIQLWCLSRHLFPN